MLKWQSKCSELEQSLCKSEVTAGKNKHKLMFAAVKHAVVVRVLNEVGRHSYKAIST